MHFVVSFRRFAVSNRYFAVSFSCLEMPNKHPIHGYCMCTST